jgi:hypothetical protein
MAFLAIDNSHCQEAQSDFTQCINQVWFVFCLSANVNDCASQWEFCLTHIQVLKHHAIKAWRGMEIKLNFFIIIILFNCKWVFTQWQWYYSKTEHTNNTLKWNTAHNKGHTTHNEYNANTITATTVCIVDPAAIWKKVLICFSCGIYAPWHGISFWEVVS